jgi:hypothetical protein
MLKDDPRRGEKVGESGRLAAEEAPKQPKQHQGQQEIANPSMPVHPVEPPGRVGRGDKRHDQPVE